MKNSKVLLGICLFGLALALFGFVLKRSDVVEAEYDYSNFIYKGIDNITERVYSIDFWNKNTMFLTGNVSSSVFHMSDIPVIVNENSSDRNKINSGISNILGGDYMNIGGSSHNITVIGGEGIVGAKMVEDGNANATFFGGYGNLIQGSMSFYTPTVLLGGASNIVESDHDANVIVGGSSNRVHQGAENVNILGGTNISIDGDNVIAAGQGISGNVSDSFVFHDEYNVLNVEGSGMFFIRVSNGVGFGAVTTEDNKGAISSGAVKVGNIDVEEVSCYSENIGLMGLLNGCLVGCTSGSALSGKWEMLGHSDVCRQICGNSDKCIPESGVDTFGTDYPSFCEGIVSTDRATICSSTGLDEYRNVVFETYLIDHEDECPTTGYNKCAYKCNTGYHLLTDVTGKKDYDTTCYQDCVLPWDTTHSLPKKKHNEIITAYSSSSVSCSTENNFIDSCGNYKSQLICVDGERYTTVGEDDLADRLNEDYIYETCNLSSYTCSAEYDLLTKENIVQSGYEDSIDDLSWEEGLTYEGGYELWGSRGKYQVCVDYDPGEEGGCEGNQHHYKFKECRPGYNLAEDGVCRKECEYGVWHGSGIILYTGQNPTCPNICYGKEFQCIEGILYDKSDFTTLRTDTPYIYASCNLSGVECDSSFSIDLGTYELMQNSGLFTSCQNYSVSDICNPGDVMYRLESCNANYYRSGDTCEPCPTGYTSNAGSVGLDACVITCGNGEHVASYGGPCVQCGVGKYSTGNTVNATTVSYCSDCINKPADYADYTSAGINGPESCEWECNVGCVQEGNGCVVKSAQCGAATVNWHVTEPIESLCAYGTPSSVAGLNDTYTWTCTNLTSIADCNATRKYSCGTLPSSLGVSHGSYFRDYDYIPASWTYSTNSPLGVCEWNCSEGYHLVDDECVAL